MISLVNMPFGSITWPSMALGLMKPQLAGAGLPVEVHHLNFELARQIGFGSYETIARFKGAETQVSEWLFAKSAWRRDFGPSEVEFLERCAEELANIPKIHDRVGYLRKIRNDVVPWYLERCYERLTRNGPPTVVAFSCVFFQTVASLAMGRMLKERHPEIRLVYGGACFHGEMGHELFAKLPWIDAVSLGEADDVIVELFETLLGGEVPRDLPGIIARDRSGAVFEGPPPIPIPASSLEALPDPDYDDYFAEAERVGLAAEPGWAERASVPFEASRGCWWGEKKHCTFCGLNAEGMGHRAKSPERVLATIRNLAARYDMPRMHATDNILTLSYFETVLPALIEDPVITRGKRAVIFFETKANLTRAQIKRLADAGMTSVQPGIENLATNSLRAIDKGVTALQNAFFLKCAAEYGVQVTWNILIRLPGESLDDYRQMERWIPLMFHLRPPYWGAPRVECHRYSPYHFRAGVFTENVRAASWYRGLFPADQIDLDRVAYYFDATWKNTLGDPHYDGVLRLVGEWMRRWREEPEQPRLTMRQRADGGLDIEDTRGGEPLCWELDPERARLYAAIADITTPRKVLAALSPEVAAGLTEEAVRAELQNLADAGLALVEGDRFLGLALPPTAREESRDLRRVAMQRPANQRPTTRAPGATRLPVITT